MKAFVLVIASIFFAPVISAQSPMPAESQKKIKILSWNIYMLPGPWGHHNKNRAKAIGSLLDSSDYDVIVFQEAFHRKARKKISRLLSPAFPFQAGPANQKLLSLKTNSGIWIFSKYPITTVKAIAFRFRSGIDAMSRKGALMAEINVENQKIQVVGTHLQNGPKAELRHLQCGELFEGLLEKYEQPGTPQVVCGDFNISKHDAVDDYNMMLRLLDATDGELSGSHQYSYDHSGNDLGVEPGLNHELIDYIFLRSFDPWALLPERKIRIFQTSWRPGHRDLSDHYSMEIEIKLTPNSRSQTASINK